jgi:hypothetical protein
MTLTSTPRLGCVYDIKKDPGETVDLARSDPGLLAQLRARFLEMNATQWNVPRCLALDVKVVLTPPCIFH